MKSFKERISDVVKKIPRGEVLTYKEVAKRAGKQYAYRAVGNILSQNKDPKVPCHRVIRSDGKIGGYNGAFGMKRELLREEGYLK